MLYDQLGSRCFWKTQPGPAYKSTSQSLTSGSSIHPYKPLLSNIKTAYLELAHPINNPLDPQSKIPRPRPINFTTGTAAIFPKR